MDKIIAEGSKALVPALLALVGVRVSEVLGIQSNAWKMLAAAGGALGGVMLANRLTK